MHTPGPWQTVNDAVPEGVTQVTVYSEATGDRVATVFQTPANASLVKAAPDLLKALKVLTSHAEETYPHFEDLRGRQDIAQANEAIQKAEEE